MNKKKTVIEKFGKIPLIVFAVANILMLIAMYFMLVFYKLI